MQTFSAAVASDEVFRLAEGPHWDESRDRIVWVDIPAGMVCLGELRGDVIGTVDRLQFGGPVAAAVPSADGWLLVAEEKVLTHIDPAGIRTEGPRILPIDARSRTNDGACDPAGRFLVGTLGTARRSDREPGRERLVQVGPSDRVEVLDDDLTLSNGLAWSPDGSSFYSTDSGPGIIWVRDYEVTSGRAGVRRELFRVSDATPDGICVDEDGNIWVALWGAGMVRCYTPSGEIIAVVEVPAPNTTSVAFIGPKRDRLLITTASEGLTGEQQAAFPDSGRLFLADVAAVGSPTFGWVRDVAAP